MNWLLSLINPLTPILTNLSSAYAAKAQATNDKERIEADERIAILERQVDLAKYAAQFDKPWHPRSIMAYVATLYVVKIIAWDTVFGLGVTPDPGPIIDGIVMLILGFYYGSAALSKVASSLLERSVR